MNLINSHRASQAAETGQLTPRGRRSAQSSVMELSFSAQPSRQSASIDGTFCHNPQTIHRPSDSETSLVPLSPKISALPPAVRRSSMPDVIPFTEFCKRTLPAGCPSRPGSVGTKSRDSSPSTEPATAKHSPIDSVASTPIMLASDGAAELKLPPPGPQHRTHSNRRRRCQVVRGQGSGFEILLPGSLNRTALDELSQSASAPPVSLQNAQHVHHTRSRSQEGKNRLQKKRTPSVGSTGSRWSVGGSSTYSRLGRLSRIGIFA